MKPSYPNLELLEYKVKHRLSQDKDFTVKLQKAQSCNQWLRADVIATVFIQMWASTCTGFDVIVHEDGSTEPVIGGCAMTEEYTTVMHERITNTYIICFGNRICYSVADANTRFLDDLKNHRLAGLKEAREVY